MHFVWSKNMKINKTTVDHIPVIWCEPTSEVKKNQLALFLHPLAGNKEWAEPFLQDLAAKGYTALSFDAWQHGERNNESTDEIIQRVFSNFRRFMWPILGNTTLDVLRVIDWALSKFDVSSEVVVAGLSMGGDIAVAAAGIDQRIKKVVAVIATPDWLRPGMEDVFKPGVILPPGEPDLYAQFFYDHLNPLTHLSSFSHAPDINFICGEKDSHVPPDGALRFQKLLQENGVKSVNSIKVTLIPNMKHLDALDSGLWWSNSLEVICS